MTTMGLWILFGVVVIAALAVDLGLKSHRHRTEAVSMGEAARWTAFWIFLAFCFAGMVYAVQGHQRALEFVTAYLLEESLSVDNMFVFVLIFPILSRLGGLSAAYLKWGILGAVLMRLVFIVAGVSLLARFHWIMYVFGGLLIVTAIQMVTEDEKAVKPNENPVLKIFQRFMPVTAEPHGSDFFTIEQGRRVATPLFAALLVVEASDLCSLWIPSRRCWRCRIICLSSLRRTSLRSWDCGRSSF